MIKFDKGSGIDVLNPGASLNVGSRSYINGFDQNNDYSPDVARTSSRKSATDPRSCSPRSSTTRRPRPSCRADQRDRRGDDPDPRARPCGAASASRAAPSPSSTTATFQYGGGAVNTQDFTIASQSVLAFITDRRPTFPRAATLGPRRLGTHAYITNNNFFDNFDAAMQIEPNGLLAGDPLTPLAVGPSRSSAAT